VKPQLASGVGGGGGTIVLNDANHSDYPLISSLSTSNPTSNYQSNSRLAAINQASRQEVNDEQIELLMVGGACLNQRI
jgi:hypothetical protein